MAEQEKGFKITKMTQSEMDTKPSKPDREKVESHLHKKRPRGYDKIPLEFQGKGGGGYLLYEIVKHCGHGSPQVNRTFKDAVRWTYTDVEGSINPKVAYRMKIGGPRFAEMGRKRKTRRQGYRIK